MGTDKVVFAVDRAVDRKWHDRKWYDRKWRQSRDRNDTVRKYVLRMRNRKLCHIRPSGAFWPEVTKSRDWKRPYQEVTLTGGRFFACPAFSRAFFLVVEPDVSVTWPLFGVPLGVRNRKLCNICGDRRSRDPFRRVLGVFSTTSASYI